VVRRIAAIMGQRDDRADAHHPLPFNWIGPAPRRFIVRAHEMDAPRSERPS
jgi:hypothetical protein